MAEGGSERMKAAFVGNDEKVLYWVYAEKQCKKLFERIEMLPGVYPSVKDAALQDVDYLFSTWGMPVCTEEEVRKYLPNLKAVFFAAGSVQHFARPFLKAGVRIFSAWQANAVPVAQYAFAQILLALKGYFRVQPETRRCRKNGAALFKNYPGAFDASVGLLGCGAIGSRVAALLRDTDIETFVFDPFLSDARAEALGVQKADISEIFAKCDVVSNHLASLPATRGIIRREHLLSMQPYATFINTGRGAQLNEQDLYDMLVSDPTRTALIDVMMDEENSDQKPLNALENCLITPHIAGSSGYEVRRLAEYMIDALDCVQAGKPCSYEVTEEMLSMIDVLIDGRYVDELRNISLRFRGSENQRIIDMSKTRTEGKTVLWTGKA